MISNDRPTIVSDRIRLLQFHPFFRVGGTERHIANLTGGIDRTRFDIHLGCTRLEGEFLAEIQGLRMSVSAYPIRRLYGPATLRQQVKLARYLRRNRIEIVHSYNFHSNCFVLPAARLARTPVTVASIRDIGTYLTPRQQRAHRLACRMATVILVNAEAVRRSLIAEGYEPDRITVIPNGIDLARFASVRAGAGLHRELGAPAGAPIIALVARMNRLKGLDYFVEAAAAVVARVPQARFLLVGDAAAGTPDAGYPRELETLIHRLGLQDRVTLTGFRLDVPQLLAEVAVSVLPSLSEGLPNAVLESLAAGVPVVATRVGGIPEAVEDGVNGLLVPPRDSRALAEAILRILDDPALAARLREAGRRSVQRFSLERMVRATEDLYSSLASRHRRTGQSDCAPEAARRWSGPYLRRHLKSTMASTLHSTGGDRLLGNMAGAHGDPLILCYHRVVEDFAAHARTTIPSMLVSRRMLAQHLDWVGRRYRFVSLDDLLTRLRSGEPFAQPVAAVTFDDGYHDVYEHGLDVLREKGVPGAVYVVTDVIERGRLQVFDHLYLLLVRAQSTRRDLREALSALETSVRAVLGPRLGDPMAATQHLLTSLPQPDLLRVIATLEAHIPLDAADLAPLRPLTWDEVIRMHRAGVVIGSHTRRHQLLNHLAPDAVTDELVNSRRELERWLRAPVRHFAYPGGWFNAGVVQAVADAGYEMAVTTCRHRDSAHPRLTVPRRTAWEHASVDATFNFAPAVMGCYVNGVFDVARRCTLDHRGSPTPSPTGPAPAEARDAVAR